MPAGWRAVDTVVGKWLVWVTRVVSTSGFMFPGNIVKILRLIIIYFIISYTHFQGLLILSPKWNGSNIIVSGGFGLGHGSHTRAALATHIHWGSQVAALCTVTKIFRLTLSPLIPVITGCNTVKSAGCTLDTITSWRALCTGTTWLTLCALPTCIMLTTVTALSVCVRAINNRWKNCAAASQWK